MKIIFSSLIILCVVSVARAQVKPDALTNQLKSLTLKRSLVDSSLSKLTLPQTALTPGNYFKADTYPVEHFGSLTDINTNVVISTMPVKNIKSNDKMGIAVLGNGTEPMLIKRIVVVKP